MGLPVSNSTRGISESAKAAKGRAPSTAKGERTRERFIDEAARLFFHYGYVNITVEDICNSSNIRLTKGAFYYNFKSKEHVLFLIQEIYIRHSLEVLEGLQASDLNGQEKISRLFKNSHFVLSNMREHVVVANRERRYLTGKYARELNELRRHYRLLVQEVIEQAQSEHLFRTDIHPKIAALNYFGMLNWMYQWYDSRGDLSAEQVVEMCKTNFLYGILSREASEG